jgi:hypothetical protein
MVRQILMTKSALHPVSIRTAAGGRIMARIVFKMVATALIIQLYADRDEIQRGMDWQMFLSRIYRWWLAEMRI